MDFNSRKKERHSIQFIFKHPQTNIFFFNSWQKETSVKFRQCLNIYKLLWLLIHGIFFIFYIIQVKYLAWVTLKAVGHAMEHLQSQAAPVGEEPDEK